MNKGNRSSPPSPSGGQRKRRAEESPTSPTQEMPTAGKAERELLPEKSRTPPEIATDPADSSRRHGNSEQETPNRSPSNQSTRATPGQRTRTTGPQPESQPEERQGQKNKAAPPQSPEINSHAALAASRRPGTRKDRLPDVLNSSRRRVAHGCQAEAAARVDVTQTDRQCQPEHPQAEPEQAAPCRPRSRTQATRRYHPQEEKEAPPQESGNAAGAGATLDKAPTPSPPHHKTTTGGEGGRATRAAQGRGAEAQTGEHRHNPCVPTLPAEESSSSQTGLKNQEPNT